jgi:NAD+ kinase
MLGRKVLLVIHPTKEEAHLFAAKLASELHEVGFEIYSNSSQRIENVQPLSSLGDVADIEIAVVLGGDGTILRAAELVQGSDIPILGINMGNVGFLAEIDRPTVEEIVSGIRERRYTGDMRLLLKHSVLRAGQVVHSGWALNEVTISRNDAQMVELFVQIDGRPLSRWGCDGVIAATPTGSTAYAYSAGGPVIWPEVDAILFLPLAAHALFSRPMVISPESEIAIDIESKNSQLSADGMRTFPLERADRITISRESRSVRLVQLDGGGFTDRLVAKFKLPIEGWRGE